MTDSKNHYDTLQVSQQATQNEIKQAYRRLAKLFHPDSQHQTAGHEQIVEINAAYEVLGDPRHRQSYDQQLLEKQARTVYAERQYRQHRQTAHDTDEHLEQWLQQVYRPVNQMLARILSALKDEVEELSADPFDDELLAGFQRYLDNCRERLSKAQSAFRSMPNPPMVAGVAARLYYCLNQVGDGIDELEFFTHNYDEHYLHTGQELFRIAAGLRREAQVEIKQVL